MDLFENIKHVYNLFEDEISQDIFVKRLSYSLTRDSEFIKQIVVKHRPEFTPLESWGGLSWLFNEIPIDQEYVIWGCGQIGEMCLEYVKDDNRPIAFCDLDKNKQENGFCGYRVIDPNVLTREEYKDRIIVVASIKYERDILLKLNEMGVKKEKIYSVGAVINSALPTQYFNEPFLKFSKDEVFIDAGSYDLGSTIEFYKIHPEIAKVYAFEPDPENYRKCKSTKEKMGYEFVDLYQKGTWKNSTVLKFSEKMDSSRVEDNGSISIETVSIDEIVGENAVTYIKMDVEGAEYETLEGACKTIERCRPKLAVCVYHKPEDIINIPLYLESICNGYKFYLRHYSNSDNETVMYAIPIDK